MDCKIPLAFQEIVLQISLLRDPARAGPTDNFGPSAVTFHSQKRITWHLYLCCFFQHVPSSFRLQFTAGLLRHVLCRISRYSESTLTNVKSKVSGRFVFQREDYDEKMCRIIGSSPNVVVVCKPRNLKHFDFAFCTFDVGVESESLELYLDAVHGPASGKLNA